MINRLIVLGLAGAAASVVCAPHAMAGEPIGYFPEFLLTAPETVNDPLVVVGAPDDKYFGLGEDSVVYTLDTYRILDLPGADLNIYEADFGAAEFSLMDVLVSEDGENWVSITATMAAAINITGDELHNSLGHRKSFDLEGSGIARATHIMIQGLGTGAASGTNGFDIDAVGLIHWSVPGPGSLVALSGLVALRRRR